LANPCCPALWTDARECIQCGEDYWSNEVRDLCIPKIIEFLAFGEPLGITLIVISAFGALITIGVMVGNRGSMHTACSASCPTLIAFKHYSGILFLF
jgi:hypothetical protein